MAREFTMGARINLNTGNYSSSMADAMRTTDRFGQEIIDLDRAMGRYHDSTGRLREANGRFATSAGTATRQLQNQEQQASSLKGKLFSLQGAVAALAGSMAMAGAFDWLVNSNAEMEQYQNTLSVVLGSQQKATQQLAWAQKFAAKTPFEIPQIVEATTRLESYGIESKKVLGITGDMASVMGKDLMQAVEAVADAQTGELERMKEFGITKGMIQKQAAAMNMSIINKKGQITDQKKFNQVLFKIMEDRFKGGMALQSTTFKGMLSNVQDFMGTMGRQLGKPIFDVLKTNLESFLGFLNRLQDSGAIDAFVAGAVKGFQLLIKVVSGLGKGVATAFKYAVGIIKSLWVPIDGLIALVQGNTGKGMSMLANLGLEPQAVKGIVSTITWLKDSIVKTFGIIQGVIAAFQGSAGKGKAISIFANMGLSSGTIKGILSAVDSFKNGLAKTMAFVKTFSLYLINNFAKFKPYIIGLAIAFGTYYTWIKIVSKATKIWAAAQLAFNAVMAMNPIYLVLIAIGLLIGYLITVAGGWDVVRQKLAVLWTYMVQAWTSIWATLQPILTMIGQKAVQIWQWLVQTVPPLLAQLWTILVTWFTNIWAAISPLITTLWTGIVNIFNSLKAFWATWGGFISGYFQVLWAFWSQIFIGAAQILWAIVKGAFTVIYNIVSGVFKMISGVIQVAWALISGIFSTALNLLSGNWKGAWDSMLGMLTGVWSGIQDFFGGLKDMFFDSGVAIMKTLAEGIKSMAMAPFKAVTSALKKVRELLPFSDAHTGPLSSLTHNGGKIVSTMAEGVYSKAGTLHKAMYDTLDNTPTSTAVSVGGAKVNAAGTAKAGAIGGGRGTQIKNLIEKLVITGVDKDGKAIADEIVEALYEKLSQASDILSTANVGGLLHD